MKVSHEARLEIEFDTTWGALRQQAEKAGIPETATLSAYHYPDAVDPSYTLLVFTWGDD